jgi:hypothetical protein
MSLPFRPRFGLRADIASGDEAPANQDLQTFNPLFPKGAYFSEAGLIGPANFIDLNPCIDLHLANHLTLIFDWDFFWRESTHDARVFLYQAGSFVLTASVIAPGFSVTLNPR